jgi:2-polyprenyl-3-methyl-5-hydroxy-6-metoxy-1,4-benzoquinol methylase
MNRVDYILKYTKNKKVLDVGGIEFVEKVGEENWLHKKIAESAKYILGVDLNKKGVEKAREMGYNFIFGDAENLDKYVNEKFDVCVAGELIEHLANPGLFLQSVYKVLEDDGRLILTTPNAFALGNIIRILKYALRLKVPPDLPEHKAWYDLFTLKQLLNSQGFEVEEIFTVRPEREVSILSKIKNILYGNANSKIFCVAKKNKK